MTYSTTRFQKLAGILTEQTLTGDGPIVRPSEKQRINVSLDDGGFGGKRRFRSIGEALNIAGGILEKYDIEWDEVNSADNFREDGGHRTISLARTNREDLFSPMSIKNTALGFSWTKLDDDRYEVIAYLG